jgi:small subunit ribosomal protein S21
MAKVIARENESTDDLIRRFKRQVNNDGTLEECKKREFFLKKSLRRKEKSKRARNRKK